MKGRKIARKGAWMPSDRAILRIAQGLAAAAAETISLYQLYDTLAAEYIKVYQARRPYLDDRKIFFYRAVINAVDSMAVPVPWEALANLAQIW